MATLKDSEILEESVLYKEQEMDQTQELMTLKEVLQRARISETTFWRLQKKGIAPSAIRFGSRALRYRRQDIDTWLTQWIQPSWTTSA